MHTAPPASDLLGRYYANLRAQRLPEDIAKDIVRDAACCMHRGEIALDMTPEAKNG